MHNFAKKVYEDYTQIKKEMDAKIRNDDVVNNTYLITARHFLMDKAPSLLEHKEHEAKESKEYELKEHTNIDRFSKMKTEYNDYKHHQSKMTKEKANKLSYDMSEKSMHDALDKTLKDVEIFIDDTMSCTVCELEAKKIKDMLYRLSKKYPL